MKGTAKKFLSVLLSVLTVICACFTLTVYAAEESSQTDDSSEEETNAYIDSGQMNLDVIFVLDASGSMLTSDPNKVALDAFNLFTDLCDESCNAGYVVYTEKIKTSNPPVSLKDKKTLEKLKKNISDIEYDPNGDTDIALGLTKAMKMHDESKTGSNRKKVIILLSDGNTHLINGPRTVAESNKEMLSTLKSLSEKNIPVYSIGLNYDGTLDKKELQKISNQTKGKSYETKTTDELTAIASDIFSDIYQLDGTELSILNGNVNINIKDSSVFYVNIIIRSKLTAEELSPKLSDPDGEEISLTDNENVKMTSTGSYTLIKLIYPKSGVWHLHLTNADKKNCSVMQLDFYSVYIEQVVPKTADVGDNILISASLNDSKGVVKDNDLLKTIQMTAVVSGDDGDTEVALEKDTDGNYTGTFFAAKQGTYKVKTTAVSEKFHKESASARIKVGVITTSNDLGTIQHSEISDTTEGGFNPFFTFLIIVGVLILVIAAVLILKKNNDRYVPVPENNFQLPDPPPPPPFKPEKPIVMPKATDPDYVKVKLVEHDAIENLIKKGPEDAFNTNADDYKSDANLEALIKKGPEDAFNTNADDYQSDANLEALIRKGPEDPFNTNAGDYQVDPSLANLIKTGGDGLESKDKPKKNNQVNLNKKD